MKHPPVTSVITRYCIQNKAIDSKNGKKKQSFQECENR